MTAGGFARTAGERLGAYVLEAPLGRGGFSEVWRASAPGGGSVAVKVVVHPAHAAQLRTEAKALALVRGRGIVQVLAVELEHDPPFLVLELLRGGDLRSRLVAGSPGAIEAVRVFEQILSVLDRVHREGVVHGDLKPENVLFHDPETTVSPQVADFGLSRRIAQRSASLSLSASLEDARIAGTLDYMAPEQRRGEPPTPRSDVFALGVLFHELLTGERPQGVFRPPSERDATLPPVIDRAVASALAPDPELRFASAGAFLAFLHAGLGSDWQSLAQTSTRLRAHLEVDRPRRFWTSLAVGVTLAGLAVIVGAGVEAGPHASAPDGAFVLGLAGTGLGCAAALLVRRLGAPGASARRERLEALRARVERQIQAETKWAVVRAARQAAALAPPAHEAQGFVAGCATLFVLWLGWGIAGPQGLAAAAILVGACAAAVYATLRWNRETRYRRALQLRFKPGERKR